MACGALGATIDLRNKQVRCMKHKQLKKIPKVGAVPTHTSHMRSAPGYIIAKLWVIQTQVREILVTVIPKQKLPKDSD